MAFKFTRNIKVSAFISGGEMVFEFRRPTNEDINKFFQDQMDLKDEGLARMNAQDRIRIALFDQQIEAVYIEKEGGAREEIVDEDEKPIPPLSFPPDVKKKAVIRAFEMSSVHAKNF